MIFIQNTLAHYVIITAAAIAVFYLLLMGSRLLGIYLRWIDNLEITTADLREIANHGYRVILWSAVALVFHTLPIWMALATASCGLLFYQLVRVSKRVKELKHL